MDDLTRIPRSDLGGFHLEMIDGEGVLYHSAHKQAIYLNESATVVWQLCDGTRSVADVIGLLQAEYPESAEVIRTDVTQAIQSLLTQQALILEPPAAGGM